MLGPAIEAAMKNRPGARHFISLWDAYHGCTLTSADASWTTTMAPGCRIGEFFATDYYDVKPDIIVLGKALGAGFPIAAVMIRDGLEGFSIHAEELHTFANNSVSQVAAMKQIEIIQRDNLLENTSDSLAKSYLGKRYSIPPSM